MISYTTRGFDELLEKLKGFDDIVDDIKQELADELESLVQEGFDSEESPSGAKWKQWSPKYAASGQTGPGILDRTGALRSSFTARATSKGFTVKSSDRKAPWHQPTRPMLPERGLPAAWQDALEDRAEQILEETIGKL